MLSRMTSVAVIIVAFAGVGFLYGQELEPEIQPALEANAVALRGLRIAGHRERSFLIDSGQGLKEVGTRESEKEFTERVEFVLKLDGQRIYESLQYPAGQFQSGTAIDERCFDGARYFIGTADPKNNPKTPGILTIHSPSTYADQVGRNTPHIQPFELWYLHAAGFDGPAGPLNLGRPIRSLVLSRIEAGSLVSSKRIDKNGKPLLEIAVDYPEPWASSRQQKIANDHNIKDLADPVQRTLHKDVGEQRVKLAGKLRHCSFLLDPSLNYAAREMSEWRESGSVMFHTECDDFIQVDGMGPWLPRRCNVVSSAHSLRPTYVAERPVYRTSIRALKITRSDFSDGDFRIWYDYPGTVVADATHENAPKGGAFEYTVPVSTEELERVAQVDRGRRLWVIAANVCVMAIIIGVIAWKRMHTRY
jgi:hypothetical protein